VQREEHAHQSEYKQNKRPSPPSGARRPIPASALDLPQSLAHEPQWQAQRVIAETV